MGVGPEGGGTHPVSLGECKLPVGPGGKALATFLLLRSFCIKINIHVLFTVY